MIIIEIMPHRVPHGLATAQPRGARDKFCGEKILARYTNEARKRVTSSLLSRRK